MSIIGTLEGAAGEIASPILAPVGGIVSGVAGSAAGFVLQGISSWVLNGTKGALEEVAHAIGAATAPNLESTWFSSTYWRVAALAAMLTIPFLCAAAVQAVARADLSLLARVTFGYLPLSVLGVSLAAPLTMLLLAATDQMSAAVSAGAAGGGARFLDHAATVAGGLAGAAGGSPFFAVIVGLLALMAAMALAVELLIRAAAVYVVVLMLPLAFAALVWPARRVWAVRLVELLASLILAKFVIVAVLSLAAAAFTHGTPGVGELLVAMSLMLLSTFAPWALMRILPFTELASGAAGILRNEMPHPQARAAATGIAAGTGEVVMDLPARLRQHARAVYATGHEPEPASPEPVTPEPATSQPVTSELVTSQPAASETATPEQALTPESFAPAARSPGSPGGAGPAPEAAGERDRDSDSSAHNRPTSSAGTPTPFVVPESWRRAEPLRLDAQLLGAAEQSATAEPGPQRSESRPGAHPETGE